MGARVFPGRSVVDWQLWKQAVVGARVSRAIDSMVPGWSPRIWAPTVVCLGHWGLVAQNLRSHSGLFGPLGKVAQNLGSHSGLFGALGKVAQHLGYRGGVLKKTVRENSRATHCKLGNGVYKGLRRMQAIFALNRCSNKKETDHAAKIWVLCFGYRTQVAISLIAYLDSNNQPHQAKKSTSQIKPKQPTLQ